MNLEQAKGLLLRAARKAGLRGADDDAIEALLERELKTPEPTEEECRRYYERNAKQFSAGELVEASHILFAMTPRVPPGALRAKAAEVLARALQDPASFEKLAREWSNCPTAAQGGALGHLGRGDAVPEFEAALFAHARLGVLPELLSTRHGFHVVRVARRIAGRSLPFEQVRAPLEEFLRERSTARALAQYLQVLNGGSALVQ